MNKILVGGATAALVAVFALSAIAPSALAAPKGNALGYYGSPGNSAWGRSHNKHYQYYWQGQGYEDWDEFIEELRAWVARWREEHRNEYGTSASDVDITTLGASAVDEDGATLRGEVDLRDEEYADVWFAYGTRSNALTQTTAVTRIDEDDDETEFEKTVSGLNDDTTYYYRAVGKDTDGDKDYGSIKSFVTDEEGDGDTGDEPYPLTSATTHIGDTSATLNGSVDMNDFGDGVVFFVYGESESAVRDVADEYDSYDDIDVDGDDLMKVRVDTDLDGEESYSEEVTGLDEDTVHYVAVGVEYEDEDGDSVLELGNVRTFTTGDDDASDNDLPKAVTHAVTDITDDSAELHGSVDMHDYENGIVFFVYGTDATALVSVDSEFDSYEDIDEDGDDLMKVRVDTDLDGEESYSEEVTGLAGSTKYYAAVGVEYETDGGDSALIVDNLWTFTTD